ncbi:MAG TPA: phosphopantetheine-binding protein [Pseudonocardiaceae bacterium]|nr:phosphopantetheine-binding protein [Pseudonocardiaceae bacterium]
MTAKTDELTAVRTAWSGAFGKAVCDDDDFFDLGGNSVAALSICSRLEESIGTRVPLRVLFTHPRFGDYAAEVARIVGGS